MGSGGARSGVFAGVGPIGILAVTLRSGGGGGGGCRVAEASGGLTGCGLSRDRLALRAANESSNSCGDGKGWVPDALLVAVEAGDGRIQPKLLLAALLVNTRTGRTRRRLWLHPDEFL